MNNLPLGAEDDPNAPWNNEINSCQECNGEGCSQCYHTGDADYYEHEYDPEEQERN